MRLEGLVPCRLLVKTNASVLPSATAYCVMGVLQDAVVPVVAANAVTLI